MKKLAALSSAGIYFLSYVKSFAVDPDIQIQAPQQGFSNLGDFITNVIQLVFVFALIAVLIMLIWGAFEWITSGGDKDAVAKARNRILNALIGLAVLAVAFALFRFSAQFLGFKDVGNTGGFSLPVPTPPPPK